MQKHKGNPQENTSLNNDWNPYNLYYIRTTQQSIFPTSNYRATFRANTRNITLRLHQLVFLWTWTELNFGQVQVQVQFNTELNLNFFKKKVQFRFSIELLIQVQVQFRFINFKFSSGSGSMICKILSSV